MPQFNKVLNFYITPAQYVNNCDETELLELSIELERRLAIQAKEIRDIEVDYEVVVKEKYLNPTPKDQR